MSEYVPQVGDRVKHVKDIGFFATVAATGEGNWMWLKYDTDDGEPDYGTEVRSDWTKVPTFPERWINVYVGDQTGGYTARSTADACAVGDRIGVIHLHPDGSLTMEQP